MSGVSAYYSYIPELTIEQVSQPRRNKKKDEWSFDKNTCYFSIYHSHMKLILIGSRHTLDTNLYADNSDIIIEEDYSDGHVYSNASVTSALLDKMLFISQYPNGKSTTGFSRAKRDTQSNNLLNEDLVCKAGLVVLHVLDKVYQQKSGLIDYTLKNTSSDFLPICVKPVTRDDLEEDLKEIKGIADSGPLCITPNVNLSLQRTKVTSLDKKLGTSVVLENIIRNSDPEYQFDSCHESYYQAQTDNHPTVIKRYDILQQELSKVLDETEYSLYLVSSLKTWFDYADANPIAEDCATRPSYINLEKDVEMFAKHMSFSYSSEF